MNGGGKCKIRKRGNSSSSSSSMAKNYRLKRPILVVKRAGTSTPVPTWKMTSSPTTTGSAAVSPSSSLQNEKSVVKKYHQRKVSESMSARKLAATLWEINEVASPFKKQNLELDDININLERIDHKNTTNPSHSPVLERRNRHERRISASSSQIMLPDNNLRRLNSVHDASRFIEAPQVGSQPGGQTTNVHRAGVGNRLQDVGESLATSKELLKVLNHVSGLEAKHPASISVYSALKWELHRARVQVGKLIQEQMSNHGEIDYLLKQFADERRAWKIKGQDRILRAVTSTAEELEAERKLRKQTERLNKKLGRELANTKACLSKVVKEVESEKRAREILEQVCDELAIGIGEDRAEFDELKKESAKVREEVEKEREMLQLADVLREERVQMKLSEAKYEYEEKNAAVDKLKSELEEYLKAKNKERKGDLSPNDDRIKELEEYLKKTLARSCQNRGKKDLREVLNGEDSADSDLRSIELNMDNNRKSFEWSYAYAIASQNDSARISTDDQIATGRPIPEEETEQKHISLERNVSDCIDWDFSNINHQEGLGGFAIEKLSGYPLVAQKNDYEDEIKRYKMIKDLRDHIVSGSGLASCQGLAVLQEAV